MGVAGKVLAVAVVAGFLLTNSDLPLGPREAAAPLMNPVVLLKERKDHARQVARLAEAARLKMLSQLQLSGIAGRRVAQPARKVRHTAKRRLASRRALPPSSSGDPLDSYLEVLGPNAILSVLAASKSSLQQQVLNDSRVSIYPGGRADVASGKVDVRVLALIEYLAEANGSLTVSCLIAGHSLYVHGRPGVISAHIFGRAVDISAVGGIPILGHQGSGSITERAIRQIMALPPELAPKQIISLMTLGGPSFALPDHANHIHVGY
jgi:hypothetical protein